MILTLIEEAVSQGTRRHKACEILGIDRRTEQRWRQHGGRIDQRRGRRRPANKLSTEERKRLLETVNQPEYRNLSPRQIVPMLADQGIYIASESTMYRVLRQEKQLMHRGRTRPKTRRPSNTHLATGPNQVWSWDITYLRTKVRGCFLYAYLVTDVWSRKIVGWQIHDNESADHASMLIVSSCHAENVGDNELVLHADNGGPMKAATMLATLERLGVSPSFSRPRVSDDNAFCEALFRTLKYCPSYPQGGRFEEMTQAKLWMTRFVHWYNHIHLHSAIRYVTPAQRHTGNDKKILRQRTLVYQQARERTPERWRSETTRNWQPIQEVWLNKRNLRPGLPDKITNMRQLN